MRRLLSVFLLVLLASIVAFAQSGRRVTPNPTPAPTPVIDDSTQYSESKPHGSRTIRAADRFPGIGDGRNAQVTRPAESSTSSQNKDDEVLKIETNLITIPVSVFDRNGLYIPGLRQNEFKIYENGVEQEIAYFGTTDKPFTVAILIDTSPSTAYKIDEIRRSAMALVDKLEPQDSVIVIEFNSSVRVLAEATMDRNKVYKAINRDRKSVV